MIYIRPHLHATPTLFFQYKFFFYQIRLIYLMIAAVLADTAYLSVLSR